MSIKFTLGYGGSGTGTTWWEAFMRCPRRARLDKEASEAGQGNSGGNKNTARGTLCHAFAELYHYRIGKRFDLSEVEFGPADHFCLSDPTFRVEAERVFEQYMDMVPVDALGKVLGAEMPLPPEGYDLKELSRLHGHIGASPWTGLIDMKVDIQDCHVNGLVNSLGIEIETGRYIVDHKFLGRRDNLLVDKYQSSTQLLTYIDAHNFIYPEDKVKGAIVNIIYCTKEIGLQRVYVAPPTDEQKKSLSMWFETAYQMSQGPMADFANVGDCFSWFSMCKYKQDGTCKGY